MRLEGKVALVTGGGRGIGRTAAEVMARQGAAVAVCSRTIAELDDVAASITDGGGRALALSVDVTNATGAQESVQQVVDEWGRLDILFNSAGINPRGPFLDTPATEWRRCFEVNVHGIANFCRAALPVMIRQHGGHIINVSSGMGLVGHANASAYAASKAAVHIFTQALAEEVYPHGILVNNYIPGPVKTELTRELWEPLSGDSDQRFPSERWKEPRELEESILFLACQDPTGMTGQTLNLMRRSP